MIHIINDFKELEMIKEVRIQRCFPNQKNDQIEEHISDYIVRELHLKIAIYAKLPSVKEIQQEIKATSPERFYEKHLYNLQRESDLRISPVELESLVVGNLYAEGYVSDLQQIRTIYIDPTGCFVFVEAEIDEKDRITCEVGLAPIEIDYKRLLERGNQILKESPLFFKTGALHTSALIENGDILYKYSDVGRHNTIDKLIGKALLDGRELNQTLVYTSGRAPSDMVAKVIRAGIPVMASRSAATEGGVALAKMHKLTLFGFVRGEYFNIYNGY